jgi:hypothetical protein
MKAPTMHLRVTLDATIWQMAIGEALMAEIADRVHEVYAELEADVRLNGVRGAALYRELVESLVVWLDRVKLRPTDAERAR